jgi:hypothetical protein
MTPAGGPLRRHATTIAAIAMGVLVRAPLLGAGFVSDDHVLLAGIEHRSALGNTPSNLWSFYDGIPAHVARLVRGGGLPWWTEPTASHAFFRPLSSLLLVGVHAVCGDNAAGYYAMLLALSAWNGAIAVRIFGRLLPRGAATIALFVFVLHALGVEPTRWISAVHVPLATALVLTGWWWQLRARLDGWGPGRFASVAAFTAGLLAGEAALGPLAFVVAHGIASERDTRRRLSAAIGPPIVLAIVYVALYRALHRGAHGIDGYLDPGEHPARFLVAMARRCALLPELLVGPADGAVGAQVLGGALAVLAFAAFAFDRSAWRACAVWATASVVCALPALMGPTDRALYPATVGSSAVIGILVASSWGVVRARVRAGEQAGERALSGGRSARLAWLALRAVAGAAGLVVVGAHVVGGALAHFEAARAMSAIAARQERAVTTLEIARPESTDVVVLVAGDQASGPWGGLVYAFATGARPRSWQALSLTPVPHTVGRLDGATIEIAPAGGVPFEMHLYRNADDHPMHVGDRAETPRLTVEVVAVDSGRPTRIQVHADRSLDDPVFLFATRGEDGLQPVRLPPVGMGMVVP